MLGSIRFDGGVAGPLLPQTTRYDQADMQIVGSTAFSKQGVRGNVWGLQWLDAEIDPKASFPSTSSRRGIDGSRLPPPRCPKRPGCTVRNSRWRLLASPTPRRPPGMGAPGPARGPFTVDLTDGSRVTYCWYRFVDQPSFQQYEWSEEKKAKLQALVERIHAQWPLTGLHAAARVRFTGRWTPRSWSPSQGTGSWLCSIVTRQEATRR